MSEQEEFERERELFHRLCSVKPADRRRLMDELAGADSRLRARLEALLAAEEKPALDVPDPSDAPPPTIEGYRLVRMIGDGGMGEVYEAEQMTPIRRKVALKLIRWGMDTETVVRRFESERQALALMDHPNIASVFDAGSTDQGRPYFAMELVDGAPITDYCDTRHLSVNERLELFIQVCRGVQHAHQKGIIHRDLKPANILVAESGGVALPKIIDFGVAKAVDRRLTEQSVFTELGQWIGTPEYMSPEQAEISNRDIDTRSDVYSLGVVLYELLAGDQPLSESDLRAVGFDEMRDRIREQEPPRPSTRVRTTSTENRDVPHHRETSARELIRALKGDLDRLTMKALEKDREQRYGSPSELAADIGRHLRQEPIQAAPPGGLYRARKFVRRHRAAVVAVCFCAIALITGLALAMTGLARARASEREAVAQAAAAREVATFLEETFSVMDPGTRSGGVASARDMLQHGSDRITGALRDQPLARARLMATIGGVATSLGFYDMAEPLLTDALQIQVDQLGARHPDIARTLLTTGWLAYWRADFEQALDMFNEASTILDDAQDPEGVRLAMSARFAAGLAGMLTGDLAGAGNALDLALDDAEAALGANDPVISDGLLYAGHLRFELAEYEEAGRFYQRAASIRKAKWGEEHSQYAPVAVALSRTYRMTGRLDEAAAEMRRAIDALEGAYGPVHPLLADALGSHGTTLRAQGDLESAVRHYERALAILALHFGPEHSKNSWLLRGLARTQLRLGELEEAGASARDALRISGCAPGDRRIECARIYSIIGRSELRLGHARDALGAYEMSLAISERVLGTSHPTVASTHYSIACCAALEGRSRRALEELRKAFDAGYSSPSIATDPDLASLRGHADFEAMVREIEVPRPR